MSEKVVDIVCAIIHQIFSCLTSILQLVKTDAHIPVIVIQSLLDRIAVTLTYVLTWI